MFFVQRSFMQRETQNRQHADEVQGFSCGCAHSGDAQAVLVGAERDLSSAGHQEHLPPALGFPVYAIGSPSFRWSPNPSYDCAPAHVDRCMSSNPPRYTPASPRLFGVWDLDLGHVSGSFTNRDGGSRPGVLS